MNSTDLQYKDLLRHVMSNGVRKLDRTGIGTVSVFGHQMRFNMREGFPLLTTKKIHTKSVVGELLWFLKGGDNIKYLVDNDVNIWNEWPHQRYSKESAKDSQKYPPLTIKEFVEKIKTDDYFAKIWGDLGPVYGSQWVKWKGTKKNSDEFSVNQIDLMIEDLKNNPDSRRIMVSAWNVSQVPDMLLPPCHYHYQLWTRELTAKERQTWYDLNGYDGKGMVKLVGLLLKDSTDAQDDKVVNKFAHDFYDGELVPKRAISLMFNMRSVDCFLGMPFDIASYGILLHLIAHCTGMVADELLVTSGDTHIYTNHFDQVNTQLARDPYQLPQIKINQGVRNIYDFDFDDIKFENYQCHPAIKAEVAV